MDEVYKIAVKYDIFNQNIPNSVCLATLWFKFDARYDDFVNHVSRNLSKMLIS
jgi:hypothetical protein